MTAEMHFFPDHLTDAEQDDAARILKIIFEEFSCALSTATQSWKKAGRILKVLLWSGASAGFEQVSSGVKPSWHLLVVVNNARLTSFADCWATAQERLRCEAYIQGTLSNAIHVLVKSLSDVNCELARGTPFFIDIVRAAITLYDDGSSEFSTPIDLPEADARSLGRVHFQFWFVHSDSARQLARFSMERHAPRDAAFLFHQAVERAYHCVLMCLKLYSPKTHNLELLRSISEEVAPVLRSAWPRQSRFQKRCFDRLCKSYVDARYKREFHIRYEELAWIDERVSALQELVRVESAIHDLPQTTRNVFNARRVESLEYEGIGERFGIDVREVERNIHYALDRISKTLS